MANPQVEDGFTKMANEIMDALGRTRIPGEPRQILDVVLRKTYGWGKKRDHISISQFNKATGIKKPSIIRAIKMLITMNLIIVSNNANAQGQEYEFNKDYDSWQPLAKKLTVKDGSSTVTLEDIKANIRKRDNNTCQICDKTGSMFPVHHIDYNQSNNEETNLITLCPSCHSRTNSNYDMWKEKLALLLTEKLLTKKLTTVSKEAKKRLQKCYPQKKKENTKEIYAPFFEEFWKNYPARNGKKIGKDTTFDYFCDLKPCEVLVCIQAAKNYADSEMVSDGIGIKDPQRFLISGRGKQKTQFWREWVEPEKKTAPDDNAPPPEEEKPREPAGPHWYIGAGGIVREYGTDRAVTEEEKAERARKKTEVDSNPVMGLIQGMMG